MRILKPDGIANVAFQPQHFSMTADSVLLVGSENGDIMLLELRLNKISVLPSLRSRCLCLTAHPVEPTFAWIDQSGKLTVQNFGGSVISIFASETRYEYRHCIFSEDGEFLWTIARTIPNEFELQLIECNTWRLVKQKMLTDPFIDSSCLIVQTGIANLLSLWFASPQDGQQLYWLTKNADQLNASLVKSLRDKTPPVFSPTAQRILVSGEAIVQYSFPELKKIGKSLRSPVRSDYFAESLAYLGDLEALARTDEGRMFVFNTDQMKIVDECAIEEHEPRPIGEYYPSLAHESGWGTDLLHFQQFGRYIIFVYGGQPRGNAATIIWYLDQN